MQNKVFKESVIRISVICFIVLFIITIFIGHTLHVLCGFILGSFLGIIRLSWFRNMLLKTMGNKLLRKNTIVNFLLFYLTVIIVLLKAISYSMFFFFSILAGIIITPVYVVLVNLHNTKNS